MDRPILREKAKETKEYGKNPILPTSGSKATYRAFYMPLDEEMRYDLRLDVLTSQGEAWAIRTHIIDYLRVI